MDSRWHPHGGWKEQARGAGGSRTHIWDVSDFRVALLTEAKQPNTIHGSKAVGEPPLMLAISVREAIRDAVSCFKIETDFILLSPCTGEAVMMLIAKNALKEGRSPNRPSP